MARVRPEDQARACRSSLLAFSASIRRHSPNPRRRRPFATGEQVRSSRRERESSTLAARGFLWGRLTLAHAFAMFPCIPRCSRSRSTGAGDVLDYRGQRRQTRRRAPGSAKDLISRRQFRSTQVTSQAGISPDQLSNYGYADPGLRSRSQVVTGGGAVI